jgi:hypothetical protein
MPFHVRHVGSERRGGRWAARSRRAPGQRRTDLLRFTTQRALRSKPARAPNRRQGDDRFDSERSLGAFDAGKHEVGEPVCRAHLEVVTPKGHVALQGYRAAGSECKSFGHCLVLVVDGRRNYRETTKLVMR